MEYWSMTHYYCGNCEAEIDIREDKKCEFCGEIIEKPKKKQKKIKKSS